MLVRRRAGVGRRLLEVYQGSIRKLERFVDDADNIEHEPTY